MGKAQYFSLDFMLSISIILVSIMVMLYSINMMYAVPEKYTTQRDFVYLQNFKINNTALIYGGIINDGIFTQLASDPNKLGLANSVFFLEDKEHIQTIDGVGFIGSNINLSCDVNYITIVCYYGSNEEECPYIMLDGYQKLDLSEFGSISEPAVLIISESKVNAAQQEEFTNYIQNELQNNISLFLIGDIFTGTREFLGVRFSRQAGSQTSEVIHAEEVFGYLLGEGIDLDNKNYIENISADKFRELAMYDGDINIGRWKYNDSRVTYVAGIVDNIFFRETVNYHAKENLSFARSTVLIQKDYMIAKQRLVEGVLFQWT